MRTPLCDLLGIEVPVVLAPMGGAVTPLLSAAVSNAGGLGMLPLTWTAPEQVASVVAETRQQTELPFGVNLGLAWDQREGLASAISAGARALSRSFGGMPAA
jgi:nitronate monooxygenase